MSSSARVGTTERPLRVAVVGSGPAGFYAAQALLKQKNITVTLDMYERLPTPYGLVRGGVAPDHQSIKAVTRIYERAAEALNFRFFGNVHVGQTLSVAELSQRYDQIVFAVGNETSRRLGIPGEGIKRCTPASVFVGWYNGHPDYRDATFDLSVRQVAVIGNGNVAVDVARVLAKDAEELASTDIADHALQSLSQSAIEDIYLIGRRGPVQAAFTPAELKELGQLHSAEPVVAPAELELDAGSAAALEQAPPRTQRNVALLREFAARGVSKKSPRRIHLRFLLSPVEVLPDLEADEQSGVRGLRVEHNRLAPADDGRLRAERTGVFEELEVGMVLPAIGYEGVPLPGVPFDAQRGVIANIDGRVAEPMGDVVGNQYVVGWARTGPRGLIGSHKAASGEVVAAMLADLDAGTVAPKPLPDASEIIRLLDERDVRAVTFDDWKALDRIEVERGARRGAPRRKVTRVDEMLDLLDEDPPGDGPP